MKHEEQETTALANNNTPDIVLVVDESSPSTTTSTTSCSIRKNAMSLEHQSLIMEDQDQDQDQEQQQPFITPEKYDDEGEEEERLKKEEKNTPSISGLFFYRFIYFLSALASSAWGRFRIIYYNEVRNLSAQRIGIIQGLSPLISMIAQPILGCISDRIQSRKLVYIICQIVSMMSVLLLPLVGDDNFEMIMICVVIMSISQSTGGILDAHALDFLGTKHRDMYGSIRLYTAIGWGLGSMMMGYIADQFGFYCNFVLYGILMILSIFILSLYLPSRSKSEQERYYNNNNNNKNKNKSKQQSSRPKPKFMVLVKAICKFNVLFWLLEVTILGGVLSLIESFLFVFLQNELQASTKLCGYTVGVSVLLELPFFYYSKTLLRLIGHDMLFIISLLTYSIRLYGYTILTPKTVYFILPLELLHGIAFASMWIASIDFSAIIAPEEWLTTVQTILTTTLRCVGGSLGSFIGGFIMERYNDSSILIFKGTSYILFTFLILHLYVWIVLKQGYDDFLKRKKKETGGFTAAATATITTIKGELKKWKQ